MEPNPPSTPGVDWIKAAKPQFDAGEKNILRGRISGPVVSFVIPFVFFVMNLPAVVPDRNRSG